MPVGKPGQPPPRGTRRMFFPIEHPELKPQLVALLDTVDATTEQVGAVETLQLLLDMTATLSKGWGDERADILCTIFTSAVLKVFPDEDELIHELKALFIDRPPRNDMVAQWLEPTPTNGEKPN